MSFLWCNSSVQLNFKSGQSVQNPCLCAHELYISPLQIKKKYINSYFPICFCVWGNILKKRKERKLDELRGEKTGNCWELEIPHLLTHGHLYWLCVVIISNTPVVWKQVILIYIIWTNLMQHYKLKIWSMRRLKTFWYLIHPVKEKKNHFKLWWAACHRKLSQVGSLWFLWICTTKAAAVIRTVHAAFLLHFASASHYIISFPKPPSGFFI